MKLPFLIIIPHGGTSIPEELSGYESLSPFHLFIESDAGANFIYNLSEYGCPVVKSQISRLFIDTDRDYRSVYPVTESGVIKKITAMNRPVFIDDCYPDEIAISNILRRYYFSFHRQIRDSLNSFMPEMIIQCHTHLPVGPEKSRDRGMPRPLVMTGYTTGGDEKLNRTSSADMAAGLASILSRALSGEGDTVAEKYTVKDLSDESHMMKLYGSKKIPMLYLSLSSSLMLTDRFFDLENIEISEERLKNLRGIIAESLIKFYRKYF